LKIKNFKYFLFSGCYTRSVLDAIFESNNKRQWVTIKQPGEEFSNKTFWTAKESSLQEMKEFDNTKHMKTRTESQKPRASPHVTKKR